MHRICIFLLIWLWACQSKDAPSPKIEARSIDSPDSLSVSYIMGLFDPATDDRFVQIDRRYADRSGLYLRREAYDAFRAMYNQAVTDSVHLIIRSAARNFEYQKRIWERKWSGEGAIENGERLNETTPDPYERAKKILRFSSMPGTSRHHWGTDIDLCSFKNDWFLSGEGKKVYDWLTTYAADYGYCQVYTEKGNRRPHGYELERWHWSYIPLAEQFTAFAERQLTDSMIHGFKGDKVADSLQVVSHYVLGIDPACRRFSY